MVDTICAIATAHGVGGISIVRLSGVDAIAIAQKIIKKSSLKPRYALLCDLFDKKDDLIDEAIVIYFKNPRSYTGEDVIEFQSHGGTITASRILDTCLHYGAKLATPGEFTKRAVINGKMNLSQAEAAAKLIESKSIDAAKILAKQLKGDLQYYVDDLRDKLVEILAFIEVNIDYAEEDLPVELQEQIKQKLHSIAKQLKLTLLASKNRDGLIDGFKVAIVGKPNVGKSSLLNALLSYDRAIISDIAGTTRDTIEEEIKINTHLVKIVDTAGIRDSGDSIEKIGIERSIEAIKSADVVIALFDGSAILNDDDQKILTLLEQYRSDKEIIVAVNKNDLAQLIDLKPLAPFNPLHISAKNDFLPVIESMSRVLETKTVDNDLILISKRQIAAATKSHDAIMRSFALLEGGELEFFAYEVNEAIESIASITQTFERDEILDKMFGNFCLGK